MRETFVRLIRLYDLLQSQRGHTAAELATVLQVSERTVFRYISILRSAGCELVTGEDQSGYRLHSGKIRPVPLAEGDVLSLMLAARLARELPSASLRAGLEVAQVQLLARLARPARERVCRIVRSTAVRDGRTRAGDGVPPDDAIMDTLIQAIGQNLPVRVRYGEGHATCTTLLRQTRLMLRNEGWCVRGRSTWHRRPVTIQLAAIEWAEAVSADVAIAARTSQPVKVHRA